MLEGELTYSVSPQEAKHGHERTGRFLHGAREAWLSYAMEAYARGLRGNADGFARAQLIALARLVWAIEH